MNRVYELLEILEAFKKHCCEEVVLTNKGRMHLMPVYKQTHDKRDSAESSHAYLRKIRVIVCNVGYFLEEYHSSQK